MRNIVFQEPEIYENYDPVRRLGKMWDSIRVPIIVPLLRFAVYLCLGMSIMLFLERVYMAIVIVFVRILRKKKYTKYQLDAIKEDLEINRNYPMVLVQIPMFNEKEVYKLSIGAVCSLSWPSDRLIVQVLDDSTNEELRRLVELECRKWIAKGVNVKYETRNNRNGYKAGALKEGLRKDYVEDCEFVVIFDADFQPDGDFLWRTIPYLLENPELALVQARWKFVNADECLMTRLQEMSLHYHFGVEQEVGSSTCSFFGFNGTAGVWRIKALHDAGGWKDRTTVEDMDLAVRASLKGWKFLFVGDLEVKNELPSTFKAYRYQQHRWSCGPANLFRKMFKEIIMSCVAMEEMASTILVPEVHLPRPLAIYLPACITILNALSVIRHEDPAEKIKFVSFQFHVKLCYETDWECLHLLCPQVYASARLLDTV
ncbi:cellulose synthase like [Striga asiatica]|uniref:glucomannan 4-beta-mannosyltransferase n=1 Tax=Striga asiatica TaxID=4170 RepID=A0A5A7PVF9_STRAF|nr:cellulose synthase like [Striga asiatica]